MKKSLLTLLLIICLCPLAFSNEQPANNTLQKATVYQVKNKFGLKSGDTILTEANYTKVIKLGENAWIVQYKNKYGVMNHKGEIIVPIKYRWADRIGSNLVKLGNDNDYGVYNDLGEVIILPDYSLIERISKDFFLTCQNYKYGLVDMSGNIVLENMFDSIFIPDEKTLVLQYQGEWFKLDILKKEDIGFEIKKSQDDGANSIGEVMVKTGAISGYSVLTFTDYVLKLFSSLSPAYEATIDELMFAKGGDAVPVIMKFTWLPKMPFTYVKNYYKQIRKKESDVLSQPRYYLKRKYK